jgi:hypothetical protein
MGKRGSSGRPRTERRELEREARKLAEARARLARLEAGGTPGRPIDVESASQIEPRALGLACSTCVIDRSAMRFDEHEAVQREGERLRIVRMHCGVCGTRRDVWFRIAPSLAS